MPCQDRRNYRNPSPVKYILKWFHIAAINLSCEALPRNLSEAGIFLAIVNFSIHSLPPSPPRFGIIHSYTSSHHVY
jgi:hypothetical protein